MTADQARSELEKVLRKSAVINLARSKARIYGLRSESDVDDAIARANLLILEALSVQDPEFLEKFEKYGAKNVFIKYVQGRALHIASKPRAGARKRYTGESLTLEDCLKKGKLTDKQRERCDMLRQKLDDGTIELWELRKRENPYWGRAGIVAVETADESGEVSEGVEESLKAEQERRIEVARGKAEAEYRREVARSRAIRSIPDELERELFKLKEQGYSYKQLVEGTGLDERQVRNFLDSAEERVKAFLREHGGESLGFMRKGLGFGGTLMVLAAAGGLLWLLNRKKES